MELVEPNCDCLFLGEGRVDGQLETLTFEELGFAEVKGVDWYGLFVPAKTPRAIVDKLHANTIAAVQNATVADSLEEADFDPYTLPQAEFARRIQAGTLHWDPVVEASGFTAES